MGIDISSVRLKSGCSLYSCQLQCFAFLFMLCLLEFSELASLEGNALLGDVDPEASISAD